MCHRINEAYNLSPWYLSPLGVGTLIPQKDSDLNLPVGNRVGAEKYTVRPLAPLSRNRTQQLIYNPATNAALYIR